MPKKEQLTPEQAEELKQLYFHGCTYRDMEARTGIPFQTCFAHIQRVRLTDEFQAELAAYQKAVREKTGAILHDALTNYAKLVALSINQNLEATEQGDHVASKEIQPLGSSLGIAVDKMRLLNGDSTVNVDGSVNVQKFEDF